MNELIHPKALEVLRALAEEQESSPEGHDIARSLRVIIEKEAHFRAYVTTRWLTNGHLCVLTEGDLAQILGAIAAAPNVFDDHMSDAAETYDYRLRLTEYVDPTTGGTRWAMSFEDGGTLQVSDNELRADAQYRYEELLEILTGGQP